LNGVKNQKIMKENIELTPPLEENATTVVGVVIMLGIAQKEEEGLIQEEDIIAEEDIEVDQEVTIIEEGIQDLEVPDQEVIEKEVIEDIEDIEAEVEAEEVEVVVFLEEVEIGIETVKEAEINLVEVKIVLIGVKNLVEVIIVNKIEKILKKMKKIFKMKI
jgi:hypothetical protein